MALQFFQMKAIMRAAIHAQGIDGKRGLPLLFRGRAGQAKTAIGKEIAYEDGLACEILDNTLGDADFGTLRIPDAKGEFLRAPRMDWTLKFDDGGGHGLVIVDEIFSFPEHIQRPLMGLTLRRVVGADELPKDVAVLAFGNPPTAQNGGYDLIRPLLNRYGHIEWPDVDAKTIASHVMAGFPKPARQVGASTVRAEVDAVWNAHFARSCGLAAGWVQRQPDVLANEPPPESAQLSWCTPRTLELATRADCIGRILLQQAYKDTDGSTKLSGALHHSELTFELVAAFIGAGNAQMLAAYAANSDLQDMEKVLDGAAKFQMDAERLDRTAAALSSGTALVAPKNAERRVERACVLWKILDDVCTGVAADLAVTCAITLGRRDVKLTRQENVEPGKDELRKASRPALAKLNGAMAAMGYFAETA